MANVQAIVRDYTLRATAQGVSETVAAAQQLGTVTDALATKTEKSTVAQLSVQRALERTAQRLNDEYRSTQRLADAQTLLERARAQGLEGTAAYGAALAGVTSAQGRMVAANDNLGKSHAGLSTQAMSLQHAMRSSIEQIAMGVSPTQVLTQQMNHLSYAATGPGGLSGAFSELRAGLAAMITPAVLMVGSVGALALGAALAANSWKSFALALDDAARRAGITSSEMAKLQAAASFKGIGSDEFAKGMAQFSQNVYEAKNNLGSLAEVMRANGVSAVKDFNDALNKAANLIQGAGSDQQKLILLQQMGLPPTMEWVRLLSQGAQGLARLKDQAAQFGGVINDEMVKRAREFDEAWNKAWTNFGLYSRNFGLGAIVTIKAMFDAIADRINAFMNMPAVRAYLSLLSAAYRLGGSFGQAVTPSQSANSRVADAFSALPAPTQLTVTPKGGTVDPEVLKRQMALEQQRIGILGNMATVEQQVRGVELGIQQARLSGVNITKNEEQALLALARAQAIGITQIRAQVDSQRIESATVFMGSGEAAAYRAVWEKVYEAKRAGRPLNEQQIRDLQSEGGELAKIVNQTDNLRQIRDTAEQFTGTLVNGLIDGKNMADTLKSAFDGLAKSMANAAIKDLFSGNFEKAGIEAVIAVGAKLASNFFDNTQEKELQKAKDAWTGMTEKLQQFEMTAKGFDLSGPASALRSLFDTAVELAKAANAAQDMPGLLKVVQGFVAGMNRIVNDFANPSIGLSDSAQKIKTLNDQAAGLIQTLADIGQSSQGASDAINGGLLKQIQAIKDDLSKSLTADINDANGKGFINSVNDLLSKQQQLLTENNAPAELINNWFQAELQKVADGLNSDEFQAFAAAFPTLTHDIHQSTDAIKSLQDQLNKTGASIVDYLNNLVGGSNSTLSPTATLSNAQAAYSGNYALAVGGNADAQAKFVSLADNLEKAARAVYASGQGYQDIRNQIINQGLALPAVQATTDPVVASLRDVLKAIQDNGDAQALDATLNTVIKSAIDDGNATAIAALLLTNGKIPTDGLNFSDFVTGLGPTKANVLTKAQVDDLKLAKDATAGGLLTNAQIDALGLSRESGNVLKVFQELDNNGNGIIEKSEAIKAATQGASGSLVQTVAIDNWHSNQNDMSRGTLQAIQDLNSTQNNVLTTLKDAFVAGGATVFPTDYSSLRAPGTSNSDAVITALRKIVYNTGVTAYNTANIQGPHAYGVFATGGVIPAHGLGLVSEHLNPTWVRAGAEPITVSPFAPSGGANDNSALLSEIRELRKEVARLQEVVSGSDAMTRRAIEENGDKVKSAVVGQTDTLAAQERQSNRQRKVA